MWGKDSIPSPQEYIETAFGRGGYLSRHWGSGYQPREGQIALAHAVDRALCGRNHLLSEAPTGTGKSLAYSIPATYHAAMHGKVVAIVTANIALQEQLVSKDLPMLGEILPWAFSFALMKGRNNYLCRSKYEEIHLATNQQSMFELEQLGFSAEERDKARLYQWATDQVQRRAYGDKSDIVGWNPSDKAWREMSVGPDDCRGSKCAFAETCGALAAQRRARACKVVVTNYHMFFTHLRVYMDRGIDVILPPFDAVVFDEAHAAAAVARDFFGWQLTEGSIRRLTRHVRDENPDLAERTQRASSWFFSQMLGLRRDRDRYKARILPEKLNNDDHAAGKALIERLGDIRSLVTKEIELFVSDTDRVGRAEVVQRGIERAAGAVASVLNGGEDNDVLFIEEDEFHKSAQVSCRLVQPAQVLRGALFGKTIVHVPPAGEDELYEEKEVEPEPVSVICTSATLATDSGFKFAREELGAPGCEELIVDSPFDYENQALFIIPDVVDPNDERFTAEVAAIFKRTIELARGRTLGLFTSRKRMNEVYDAVAGRTPFRIMRQDDGQRTQLIADFKQDTHSVLMGVASFWAGVDVPGESLSCVFIDKLPFPTPDDPVLDRLSETDKRAWAAYAVPRAIIELKQGFGRLIRTDTDRGVVVCCDNRLINKGYGKQFLRAMPKGMQKIRNLEAIREWLDGPGAAEPAVEDPFS
jgi:ATP-dependent DNA helicase DinG